MFNANIHGTGFHFLVMSTAPGSIYGFACGSTELSKIQKIYLFVTTSCVYAVVVIFQIGYSLLQSQ
ncbi:24523_t:CDS:2, partial [Cetraspora pellucida]